jgi:hypothetical protein
LNRNYDISDIAPETLNAMVADCNRFQDEYGYMLQPSNLLRCNYTADEMAGHDFWLTRNDHGAGFWDGSWNKAVGDKLTTAAMTFHEVNLYVGDDGKIHH